MGLGFFLVLARLRPSGGASDCATAVQGTPHRGTCGSHARKTAGRWREAWPVACVAIAVTLVLHRPAAPWHSVEGLIPAIQAVLAYAWARQSGGRRTALLACALTAALATRGAVFAESFRGSLGSTALLAACALSTACRARGRIAQRFACAALAGLAASCQGVFAIAIPLLALHSAHGEDSPGATGRLRAAASVLCAGFLTAWIGLSWRPWDWMGGIPASALASVPGPWAVRMLDPAGLGSFLVFATIVGLLAVGPGKGRWAPSWVLLASSVPCLQLHEIWSHGHDKLPGPFCLLAVPLSVIVARAFARLGWLRGRGTPLLLAPALAALGVSLVLRCRSDLVSAREIVKVAEAAPFAFALLVGSWDLRDVRVRRRMAPCSYIALLTILLSGMKRPA